MAAAINIEPGAGAFPAAGGKASHNIVSLADSRLALKERAFMNLSLNLFLELEMKFHVKSSNNEHYRVHPVYSFLEPKATGTLDIVRTAGPPKDDKLVVQWAEVPAEETDPMAPFKAGAQAGEVILPLKAE